LDEQFAWQVHGWRLNAYASSDPENEDLKGIFAGNDCDLNVLWWAMMGCLSKLGWWTAERAKGLEVLLKARRLKRR
jgi:hypothetical protein